MATAHVSCVSEEEENYLRLHLLLSGISPRAVRVLFDKEFHPSCLDASIKKEYGKLCNLKERRIINAAQWDLLFPHGSAPDSANFDITLMVALLKNLANLPKPAGGYDQLPSCTDTTPMADLARIKHYRNHLAHVKNGKIKSAFFITAWEYISGAVGRLGGIDMDEECKELKSKHLDQSTVPWNIRVQISQILDQWQKNGVNFVETRAAKHVLKCIRENSCVTITASSGVGKTATLQHVVLKMKEEGYDVLLVTNPHDIVNFYNPNQKTLFVIDDFCGTYSINQSDFNNWEPVMKRVEELIKNNLTKIIVACRLQVFKDGKFESLSIFRTNVCNFSSEEMCLSQTEKQLIAKLYLESKSSKIIQYCNLYDCFPLLCKLYHDNHKLNITDFFQNPFSVYEAEIDQLFKKKLFGKYCVLALCVMLNNRLSENVFTGEINTDTKTVIENTYEACRLNKGTSRLTLLDELNSLEHTFIKKEQGVYKTVHDKLFDFLSYYFGKKIIRCSILNAHSLVIMERFLFEEKDDMNQFITIVPPYCHQTYIQRLIYDWSNGKIQYVFLNINMKMNNFRQKFLNYVKTLDILYQRQLANICDVHNKDTVLLQCCLKGDIPLVRWCCEHGVDPNLCRYNGISPVFVSAQEGNIEILKILLDIRADINKHKSDGASPLFMACQKNHVEIVQLLLEKKADTTKCLNDGASPLFMACQKNHVEIVQLLLEKGADIDKCFHDGASPLFMACQKNHFNIVKMLLDEKADIDKCFNDGASPLFIACQKNHIKIVKLLLDKKSDTNKCFKDGASPLYIACQKNYVDIVKLLIDNGADIDQCRNNETSPLFMACKSGYTDIVKLLLKNKPNINKCSKNGRSPIFAACFAGHIGIVKLLLAKGADYNKCASEGLSLFSPQQIASKKGHMDIVALIDNHSRMEQD